MARRKKKLQEVDVDRPSPVAEIKRLKDSAIAQARHPEWGTVCGQLFLDEKITAEQYAASKLWDQTMTSYRSTLGGPAQLQAILYEGGAGGVEPDPDSPQGMLIAAEDRAAVQNYDRANDVLEVCGPAARNAVIRAVEGQFPVGTEGLMALRLGLGVLSGHWGLTLRKSVVQKR